MKKYAPVLGLAAVVMGVGLLLSQAAMAGDKAGGSCCPGKAAAAAATRPASEQAAPATHARLAAATDGEGKGCGGSCASKDGKACAKGDQCCKVTGKGCGGSCSGKSGCGDKAEGTRHAAGSNGYARLAAATTQPACGGKKDKDAKACSGCSGKASGTSASAGTDAHARLAAAGESCGGNCASKDGKPCAKGDQCCKVTGKGCGGSCSGKSGCGDKAEGTSTAAGSNGHARLAAATSQPACGGKKDKDAKACGGCSGKASGTSASAGTDAHARLAAAGESCGGNCASKDGKACAKGDQCCKVTGKGCGGSCSGKSGCGDKAEGTSAAAGTNGHARLAAASTQPACGGKKDKDEKSCCGKCGGDKPKTDASATVRPTALSEAR